MEERNIDEEVKKKIRIDFVVGIIIAVIVMLFFGYAGYVFGVDNELNIVKCTLMGATLPLVYMLLKEVWYIGTLGNIAFTIVWMMLAFYLPVLLAVVIFLGMVGIDIYFFMKYCEEKYLKELRKEETKVSFEGMSATDKYFLTSHRSYHKAHKKEEYSSFNDWEELEEYRCDRCDEVISEDEYIDNGGLCEDCYDEVFFGERYDGDDYDLYR